MPGSLSKARFIALLALRADLGRPRKVPDPLPKASEIVISDWPRRNAQLLLRLLRALAGRDEVFSLRDVERLDLETLSVAVALTMAGINGAYRKAQWQRTVRATEKAVVALIAPDAVPSRMKRSARKRQPKAPIPPEQRAAPAYPVKRPNTAGRKAAPRARPRKTR